MKILIAEDDQVSRRLLQAVLEKWEYEVVVTSNGIDAWEILQSPDAPQLAILDWMMPGMDGLQVCRQVRNKKDDRYIYLLLLTARSAKEDIIEGMHSGADDYIAKPFDKSELHVRLSAGKRVLDLQSELLTTRESLRNQATRDPLTGLPNRLLFADRLAHNIEVLRRHSAKLAVMFLDLDRFKLVNDTFGHSIGDSLLKEVTNRLTNTLREIDTIARMGGDEFTLILTDLMHVEDAKRVAERVLKAFSRPFKVKSHEIFITVSIGISIYPSDGCDAETLVKNADAAMYLAKEKGRSTYHMYTKSLSEKAEVRISLENSLRHAVERDELILHYQPCLRIATGEILGSEALLRWQHPEMGMIPPLDFIPLAEDTGLITPIGEWVIHTACKQNKAWQDAGFPHIEIAVNVSARQFRQQDFQNTVKHALAESGLDANWLVLELTESTIMHNPESAAKLLQNLKAMGVHVSIDDFGTGYSSLSYLKRFPIDTIKIDQSFIREITTNPDDAAIAGAVVAMAHSMKRRVVAEGVETLEQLEFLAQLKCDDMQGYFVSKPVNAEEFEMLIRTHKRWDRFSQPKAA
ncbi:MAG: EAL domain-containing protein [Armatimonadetes bacterium]|nr:EAL domain-containing protein [Armatimonadota bacterium]